MERHHRTIERRFETGPEARIEIESRNGNVLVQRHDVPEVRVVAVVQVEAESLAEAERDFRAVEDGMRIDGNRIRLVAPSSERTTFLFFGRGLKVDYKVLVPDQTSVQVEARNGRVEMNGLGGDARVDSRNGSVLLEKIGGHVQVESRNGRIDANDCASDLRLTGRNGSIYVARAGGNTMAETQNGDIVVQDASRGARLRSANGSLRYTGAVGAYLDLEVEGNGSIRLAVPADSRFVLDAEAVRGDIKSNLTVKESVTSSEPRPTIRLRTVNGSIRIEALEAVS